MLLDRNMKRCSPAYAITVVEVLNVILQKKCWRSRSIQNCSQRPLIIKAFTFITATKLA